MIFGRINSIVTGPACSETTLIFSLAFWVLTLVSLVFLKLDQLQYLMGQSNLWCPVRSYPKYFCSSCCHGPPEPILPQQCNWHTYMTTTTCKFCSLNSASALSKLQWWGSHNIHSVYTPLLAPGALDTLQSHCVLRRGILKKTGHM